MQSWGSKRQEQARARTSKLLSRTAADTPLWQHGVFIPFSRVCVHTLFKGLKQGYENEYETAMLCYRAP
eukprot:4115446-Heterocapsa_arctica.AAC.1